MRAPFWLSVIDVILSSVLVAPLVVAYWRGTWQLVDIYLSPSVGDLGSAWISLGFGLALHLAFALVRPPLAGHPTPSARPALFIFLSRAYTALFGVACVNAWRGPWKVLDHHLGTSVTADAASLAAAAAVLAASRTLRNISAPPFVVSVDSSRGYFCFPTALRTRPTAAENGHQTVDINHGYSPSFGIHGLLWWCVFRYILDCLLSVVVIGSLVVVVWRGAWYLIDHFLFPERADWSAWGSLVLGYSFVVCMFSLQIPMQTLCSRLEHGIWRLVVADLYILLSFCGTVNVWRGIWNLLNIYILPETPLISNWVTHLVCLFALMLFGCSNSILVRGILLDGEETGGNCVVFPVLYIRHFTQRTPEERRASEPEEELRAVEKGESAVHPLMLANHHPSEAASAERREECGGEKRDGANTPLTAGEKGNTIASDAT